MTIYKIIENDDINKFKEYIDSGYLIDRILYSICAKHNRINFLSYMLQKENNKKSWDELTSLCAAESGHLECLKFCIENGCPWDELTPAFAAGNGHLECLKYTSSKISFVTVIKAAKTNQLECFMYCFKLWLDKHDFWSIPFNLIKDESQYKIIPQRRYSI
jgi:hypothetical protein